MANAVVAKIGDGGAVCLFNSAPAHLVVDVTGTFSSSSRFAGAVPVRLADSRDGAATVDGISQGGGIHAAGSLRAVQVSGRGGVPSSATSALLNITVTESTGRGFVTVFPCGGVRPLASTSNLQPGTDVANAVFARLDAHGEVCIYTSASTHVIVDLNGSLSVRAAATHTNVASRRHLSTSWSTSAWGSNDVLRLGRAGGTRRERALGSGRTFPVPRSDEPLLGSRGGRDGSW
ncbi:MAG: hypothetical protein ACK5CE_00095 [Actinomycetes bacterium]